MKLKNNGSETPIWLLREGDLPKPKKGLIWLVSYPKSGNTWIRAVLAAVVNRPEALDINALGHENAVPVSSSRQLFQDWTGLDAGDLPLTLVRRLRGLIHARIHQTAIRPLVMKVHDRFDPPSGEAGMFQDRAAAGTIYVVRDPLDVAVSMAAHRGIDLPDAVSFLCAGDARFGGIPVDGISASSVPQLLGDWGSHVRGWTRAPLSRLLVLRYEDMLKHPLAAFGAVIRFIGMTIDDAALLAAVDAARFDRLRAMEERRGFGERPPGMKQFFRTGRSGAGRELLGSDDIRKIINAHTAIMEEFGYLADDRAAYR